jgi:hypothetical protein
VVKRKKYRVLQDCCEQQSIDNHWYNWKYASHWHFGEVSVPTVKVYSYSYIVVVTIGLEPEGKRPCNCCHWAADESHVLYSVIYYYCTSNSRRSQAFNRPLNYTIQQTLRLKCHHSAHNLTAYLSCICRFCSTAHTPGDFTKLTKFV